jgi:hypothetical protein
MTKSDQIRKLSLEGLTRSQIASSLGIRYQHVYNVLKRSGLLNSEKGRSKATSVKTKQRTQTKEFKLEQLLSLGFEKLADWKLGGPTEIILEPKPPRKPGVYAFILDSRVVYVGVSERDLRNRLGFYAKPGPTMSTSIRVKKLILDALINGGLVSVAIMTPEEASWKGLALPMHTSLEAGLIREIRPAWNLQGL